MKKSLFAVMFCAGLFCWTAAATPLTQDEIWVNDGMNDLANDELIPANTNFAAAVAFNSANADANVLLAATRLAVLGLTPAGSNFLNGLGFSKTGRSYYDWTSMLPAVSGHKHFPAIPSGYNSGTVIAFYTNTVMPAIAASLTNLANVTDTGFQLYLPGAVSLGSRGSDAQDVTLDYGDVQVLRALLGAAQFVGYTLSANNSDANLNWIETSIEKQTLTIQSVLSEFPSLGAMQNKSALADSERAATNAIRLYFGASSFILNERPNENPVDPDPLFVLPTNDYPQELEFRIELTNALASLAAPTEFAPSNIESTIYAGAYFSGNVSPRSLFPKFSGNTYVNDSIPDYTFGGILPDLPAYVTEHALRNSPFGSRVGIYTGNTVDNPNDMFDSNGYSDGAFAVFVGANGQITVLGTDNGDGTGDGTDFGFYFQTTIDVHNDWQYSNSYLSANGGVDKHGFFWANLNYANVSVYLQGNGQSPLGPFQNSAGYYTGKYSGDSSGSLYGIVAADGELYYVPGQNGNTGNDGAWSPQFSGSDNSFSASAVNGIDVQGAINTNTSVISGMWTNVGTFYNSETGTHGTFTLKRSAEIPFDSPPGISTDLPVDVVIPLGHTTAFRLVATGSAPLSYQWFFNGNAIPGATASTLTVSNNLWKAIGTYTISATVNNVVGEINSRVCEVGVTPETNVPTITITSPTSGELWSNNPTFTIAGTASDVVEVSDVYYSVNPAAYNKANLSGNNWSESVTLTPGSNSISAYSENVGGIFSKTNTVLMDYVLTALLTVNTNHGSAKPDYNNQYLRIGDNYSMTASPAANFVFASWTGWINGTQALSTNKPTVLFQMQPNLVLQANFKDALKPYLKISNAVSGMLWTNPTFTVTGLATDDEEVATVNYSSNGVAAAPLNLYANISGWSAPLTLSEGTNIFAVYALATNGNTSATNEIVIIRHPTITPFLIATNLPPGFYVDKPQAQISFDGTNYFVVFTAQTANGGTAWGQFVSPAGILIGEPLIGEPQLLNSAGSDDPPYLDFDGTNYLVAWVGDDNSVDGVFVSPTNASPGSEFSGTPKTLSQSTTVDNFSTIVYGNGNYFLMWSDWRSTPDSIYGTIVDTSGNRVTPDDIFISTNGDETEAGGISAAFDGTNFLAVWPSATGKTSINGELISTSGQVVTNMLIYTNSSPAGIGLTHVVFDGGTNYLVLFNTGVTSANSPSSYHILGRFVTTGGTVLTNQMTLTSDAGPQVVAGADFDGINFHYLVSWVQGFNPYTVDKSTTTYGRFFDTQGNPTTAEFPIWTTLPGKEIPLWAPVYWDGVNLQFVLVGGRGLMLSSQPGMTFTNNAINGALVSP